MKLLPRIRLSLISLLFFVYMCHPAAGFLVVITSRELQDPAIDKPCLSC